MNREDIQQSLVEFVRELVPKLAIRSGDERRELQDLGLDSLDVNGLLLKIQENYNLIITDEQLESLSSLSDYSEFIAKHR